MKGTCSTCGQSLHSDLSRVHGRCGPCRWAEEAAHEPTWRRLIPPERAMPKQEPVPAPQAEPET